MAKTQKIDPAAAKARKQKIMLGVIGAVLVVIAVIQVPKLTVGSSLHACRGAGRHDGRRHATPATRTPHCDSNGAGALRSLVDDPCRDPTQGKLISFSLFATKDPFVQQVGDKPASDTSPVTSDTTTTPDTGSGTPPAGTSTTPATGDTGSAGAGGSAGAAPAKPEEPVLTDATLVINGTAEYLQAKGTFPASDPVFELVKIKPKTAKIGVAGGAFANGKLLVLKMDKSITLVNTATGARYQIKLVYTGTTPETVEGFTAGSSAADTSGQTAPTTTGSSTVDVSTASK